jgi:flagellar FliL protein
MAMADEVEKSPQVEAEAERGSKKRSKLPILLSVLVVVAGGAAAAWYLGVLPGTASKAEHAEATAAVEEHGDDGGHGGNGEKGLGPILPLETFIANLADEGGSRYLKATFQIEFLGAAVPGDVTGRLPQIRDLLLTLLSSKTFDDVRTAEGKQQLREEIIARVNQVLDRDAVKAVYFTEFIVQ